MHRSRKLPRKEWRHETPDDADAFIPDRTRHDGALADDAEADAEEFIAGATSGDAVFEEARDEVAADELGGPYLEYDFTEVIDAVGEE